MKDELNVELSRGTNDHVSKPTSFWAHSAYFISAPPVYVSESNASYLFLYLPVHVLHLNDLIYACLLELPWNWSQIV